jgi:hypothetical protein
MPGKYPKKKTTKTKKKNPVKKGPTKKKRKNMGNQKKAY